LFGIIELGMKCVTKKLVSMKISASFIFLYMKLNVWKKREGNNNINEIELIENKARIYSIQLINFDFFVDDKINNIVAVSAMQTTYNKSPRKKRIR
jgi:uncharacterized HAD superfamily protein